MATLPSWTLHSTQNRAADDPTVLYGEFSIPVSRTLDNPPVDGADQGGDDHEDANDRDNTEEENGGHTHAESRA